MPVKTPGSSEPGGILPVLGVSAESEECFLPGQLLPFCGIDHDRIGKTAFRTAQNSWNGCAVGEFRIDPEKTETVLVRADCRPPFAFRIRFDRIGFAGKFPVIFIRDPDFQRLFFLSKPFSRECEFDLLSGNIQSVG